MSLSLGQSEGYINKIENKRAMPSMSGFFYICEYLKVHPRDFFDDGNSCPSDLSEIVNELKCLPDEQLKHLLAIIRDLKGK